MTVVSNGRMRNVPHLTGVDMVMLDGMIHAIGTLGLLPSN